MTLNIAELKSKGGVGYTRSTVDVPVQLDPLPQTHEGSIKYPRAVGLAVISITLVACQATALATGTATPEATQDGNPTLIAPTPAVTIESPAQIEATATPKIEISMPAPIDGLYYGSYGVDSDNRQVVTGAIDPVDFNNNNPNSPYKVPSYGNGEVQVNTLYSETNSQDAAATMLDQKWLDGYFNAQTDKTGATTGTLPNGSKVTKQGLFWVDEKGNILNPIVRNIAGDDSKFGWPMLAVKDNQLFMAIVDGDGTLVAGEQFHPAFQSPSAIAESVGFEQAKDVAQVSLTQTGILRMFDSQGRLMDEVIYLGSGEGIIDISEVVVMPVLNKISYALTKAGIGKTPEQLIQQGYVIESRTGVDGKKYEVASVYIDPNSSLTGEALEGAIPVAMRVEGGEWEGVNLKNYSAMLGINSGTLLEGGGSDEYDILKLTQRENFNSGVVTVYQDLPGGPDNYDYGYPDFEVHDAGEGMPLMTSMFIWPSVIPDWLRNGGYDKEQLMSIMTDWITNSMKRYPEIKTWQVLNEANTGDFFEKTLGPDYVVEFFKIARAARPDAVLIYNDYGNHSSLEGPNSTNGNRTQHTLDILNKLDEAGKLAGVQLVDGVGVQMVIYADELPSFDDVTATLKAYNRPVYITEFAVIMSNVPGTPEERLLKQAEIYNKLVEAILNSGCDTIVYFNQSDKNSPWENDTNLPEYSKKADPTLFDDEYNPKLAYYAVLQALHNFSAGK